MMLLRVFHSSAKFQLCRVWWFSTVDSLDDSTICIMEYLVCKLLLNKQCMTGLTVYVYVYDSETL